jgi:hypothetical protein
MPRPNEAEVARAAELLDEFKSGLDRSDRAMLDRYRGLLEVRVPPPNTAIIPNLADFFQMKHEQNLEVARAGDIELLLMGDSITDFWRNEEGNYAGPGRIFRTLENREFRDRRRYNPGCFVSLAER